MLKVLSVNKAKLRPFRGEIVYPLFNDIDDSLPFNWNTNDPIILENTFKQQLEDNVYSFMKHNINCGKLIENNDYVDDFFVGLTKEDALNRCYKFISPDVRRGYEDTFFKDTNVFEEADGEKTSQIFAIVYLSDDYVYQGHIYTWITNKNCIAFGIRGRPDKLFLTSTIKVADALINKAEAFALEYGCNKLIVPNPLRVMRNMLCDKFGFEHHPDMPVSEIGNSFVGYSQGYKQTIGACVKRLLRTNGGKTRRRRRHNKRSSSSSRRV